MMGDGEQIHSAMYPGSIFGDLFSEQTQVNIRQHALESACFVVCATAWLDADQQAQIVKDTGGNIGPISGGCFTAIVAPDGTLLGEPIRLRRRRPSIKIGGREMPTIEVLVRRFSVVSSRPFEEIVGRLTATIGHPDMNAFHSALAAARKVADLEVVVQGAIGSSDLMEFVRFDAGEVLRKERGRQGPKVLRLVVGNPLIMKEMAKTVSDAAAYAPVTILVDERADGVHLSYDSMASLLAPYGSQAALGVARDLDAKIESLLNTAAR
jgi:hypothetical protein